MQKQQLAKHYKSPSFNRLERKALLYVLKSNFVMLLLRHSQKAPAFSVTMIINYYLSRNRSICRTTHSSECEQLVNVTHTRRPP